MRVLGADPSSTLAGNAQVVDGKLLAAPVWKPDMKRPPATRLHDFYQWQDFQIASFEPDMVVIEIIAFAKSHQVTRILSRYEAAIILGAKKHNIVVIEHRVSEARKLVLGKGNLSKQEAFKEAKKMFPDFDWLPATKGGYDQADATVMALAGPALAER